MKKILILLFILLPITLVNFNVLGSWIDDSPQSFTKYTNYYRSSTDLSTDEPLSLRIDYQSSTTYGIDNIWSHIGGIAFSLRNTSGAYATSSGGASRILMMFDYNEGVLDIDLYVSNGFSSTPVLSDSFTYEEYDLDLEPYPLIYITMNTSATDSGIRITHGMNEIFLQNINFSSFDSQDQANSSTYNHSYSLHSDISTERTTDYIVNSDVLFTASNEVINTSYIVQATQYYYSLGYTQAQSDGEIFSLLDVASLVVGVVVNMVLFIANLQVFDISLITIFTLIFSIIGVIWILKVFRGN